MPNDKPRPAPPTLPASDPDFVYHYTRASTAIEHILPTMRVRLGSPKDTNDPMESRTLISAAGGGGPPPDDHSRPDALFAAREMIVGSTIACFSVDGKSLLGWQRDRMWAQYAEGHRGVCLCLDRLALEENAKKLDTPQRETIGRKVVYTDTLREELDMIALLHEGPRSYVPRYFREHGQPRHFTKLRDWEGESEYRLLLTGDKSNRADEYVSIAGALRGIYLGTRFSDGYRPCIEEVCNREGIAARLFDYLADRGWSDYFTPAP